MSPLNYFSSPPKTDEAHSCIPLSPEENLGPAPHTISVTQGAVLVPVSGTPTDSLVVRPVTRFLTPESFRHRRRLLQFRRLHKIHLPPSQLPNPD